MYIPKAYTTREAVRLVRVLLKLAVKAHRSPAGRKYADLIAADVIKIAERHGFLYALVTKKFEAVPSLF